MSRLIDFGDMLTPEQSEQHEQQLASLDPDYVDEEICGFFHTETIKLPKAVRGKRIRVSSPYATAKVYTSGTDTIDDGDFRQGRELKPGMVVALACNVDGHWHTTKAMFVVEKKEAGKKTGEFEEIVLPGWKGPGC